MSKIDNFKQELKDLLTKYNAYISCGVGEGSDTHGIYDEHIVIIIREDGKDIESRIGDGWGIGARDL